MHIWRANKPELLPIDISFQNERDKPVLDETYLITWVYRFAPITKNPLVHNEHLEDFRRTSTFMATGRRNVPLDWIR